MWGFKHTTTDRFSFWTSGEGRRAGVAILINPYGAVKNMQPWKQEPWSEHLIMTRGELVGRHLLFINIYAPVNGAVRVAFSKTLAELTFPSDVEIICGGDFNCVLDPKVDGVGGGGKKELGAAELRDFIGKWGLCDAGIDNFPKTSGPREQRDFSNKHHTHFHGSASARSGSSRLDRFYVGAAVKPLVRGVITEEALCRTDHRAVLLEMHSPTGIIRVKHRPKLYPPPVFVQAATDSLIQQMIQQLGKDLKGAAQSESATVWDQFKNSLTGKMRKLKREARERMTRGFRQRIKRIKRQLVKCTEEADLTGRASLLESLHLVQDGRRRLRRRSLIRRNAWSAKATSKAFFRRVCTKFGDSTIPHLVPARMSVRRHCHDKANILRDSWSETFSGQAEDKRNIEQFIGRYSPKWERVDMAEMDSSITEEQVVAAIARCKAGKACGPDELGNDWYKAHGEALAPVLTRIFNDCLEEGHTPSSFLEAYVHSISKGGDSSNPMNYRPIALLSTDYKIFTRIIAWRVRGYIDRLVSNRQCGFVPGRTIHEVIDMFEAAKETCRNNGELTQAQVLMLDFAKAYDSLDRDFLFAMLEAKGFPPKICRLLRAMHSHTTVRFLANGRISEKLEVTSGIRQGCPLAPLLFIIAVDLLYDVVEEEDGIRGIELSTEEGCRALKVAGYADGTAIYIAHCSMQRAALAAVSKFSAVSGLRLNIKKSVAINLGHPQQPQTAEEQGNTGAVQVSQSSRYLGHIAGSADTVEEAWNRALDTLRVRLVLAEDKTNTAQQRARIAAAVIIPKLLYVARHAWPTGEIIKRTDKCIRNYVWRSQFVDTGQPPAGWIPTELAEQSSGKGGIGLPNLKTELIALSAMVAGEWALTYDKQKQVLGDILQQRDCGEAESLVPHRAKSGRNPKATLWATGMPWAASWFGQEQSDEGTEEERIRALRGELRHRNRVATEWNNDGLQISCGGRAWTLLKRRRAERRTERGECVLDGILATSLQSLTIGDEEGRKATSAVFRKLYPRVGGLRVEDVVHFSQVTYGKMVITPITHTIPMTSATAHCFRDFSLWLVANFPELMFPQRQEDTIEVTHKLDDSHHSFAVSSAGRKQVSHTWASATTTIPWNSDREDL